MQARRLLVAVVGVTLAFSFTPAYPPHQGDYGDVMSIMSHAQQEWENDRGTTYCSGGCPPGGTYCCGGGAVAPT